MTLPILPHAEQKTPQETAQRLLTQYADLFAAVRAVGCIEECIQREELFPEDGYPSIYSPFHAAHYGEYLLGLIVERKLWYAGELPRVERDLRVVREWWERRKKERGQDAR